MKPEPEISELRNLGAYSQRVLARIGIKTRTDLAAIGAVGAYRLLRATGEKVSLNLVYAIEACLNDMHWTHLPQELKDRLRDQVRATSADVV